MITAIDHKLAIWINFVTILDFFIRRLKKTGRCREVILAVGDTHEWPLPVVESWPL